MKIITIIFCFCVLAFGDHVTRNERALPPSTTSCHKKIEAQMKESLKKKKHILINFRTLQGKEVTDFVKRDLTSEKLLEVNRLLSAGQSEFFRSYVTEKEGSYQDLVIVNKRSCKIVRYYHRVRED